VIRAKSECLCAECIRLIVLAFEIWFAVGFLAVLCV